MSEQNLYNMEFRKVEAERFCDAFFTSGNKLLFINPADSDEWLSADASAVMEVEA